MCANAPQASPAGDHTHATVESIPMPANPRKKPCQEARKRNGTYRPLDRSAPVLITDQTWAAPLLRAENSRSADYNFGNIYMWDDTYRQFLSRVDDRLITRLQYAQQPFFAFPAGSGDLRPAVEAMEDAAIRKCCHLAIRGVTEEQRALLESTYPGRFTFTEDRDTFDYIYDAEKMATYAGKKLHGKRNHCNRFEAEHDWSFQKLTPALLATCMKMLGKWIRGFDVLPEGLNEEHSAILRGFLNFQRLGLEGGILMADGKIMGFTVGEMTSDDTFDVHFEKAYPGVNGAYPMVCREFTRQLLADHPGLKYLNREDDMGLPNLRKAKEDFYPEFLLTKYTAKENCRE